MTGTVIATGTAALPSANRQPLTRIIVAIYPRPENLSYPVPVLSMGSCFRSRSKVGKDGVSARGKRTQALADLFVFGGQSAHSRQILPPLLTPNANRADTAPTATMGPDSRVHPLAPRKKQKLAGRGTTLAGGLRIALPTTKTRFDDRPSSRNANNGQTRKRAWQGASTPETKAYYLHGKSFISNLCSALTGCQFARIG